LFVWEKGYPVAIVMACMYIVEVPVFVSVAVWKGPQLYTGLW